MTKLQSKALVVVLSLLPLYVAAALPAPLVVLPGPSAQDLATAAEQTRPWRFAVGVQTQLDSATDGVWSEEGDTRVWRLAVQSPGASSLSLHFNRWQLPADAQLWVRDAYSDQAQGPYGDRYNAEGELWTAMLLSDAVEIELRAPVSAPMPRVAIAEAMHGFRATNPAAGVPLKSGTCNIDVACPEADPYADPVRATVLLVIGGNAACSGTLINNTANNFLPYVLTADHCQIDSGNDQSVVAYFNFQRSRCERGEQSSREQVDLDPQQSVSGAEFIAGNPDSDFTLLELGSVNNPASIDPAWQPYWSGWTRSEDGPSDGASIHHPSADEKSIAVFSTQLQREQLQEGGQTVDTWRVVWSAGTTEQGSSGSGIFGTDGLLRGQLYGGGASCATPSNPDFYGRFAVSWSNSAAVQKQLAVWLDPERKNPGAWGGLNFDGTYQNVDSSPVVTPTPAPATPTPKPSSNSGSGSAGGSVLLFLLVLAGGLWRPVRLFHV